jgi:hypothetical protein
MRNFENLGGQSRFFQIAFALVGSGYTVIELPDGGRHLRLRPTMGGSVSSLPGALAFLWGDGGAVRRADPGTFKRWT